MREQPHQRLIENNKNIIIFIFFSVLLFTGFKIYKDYGVHWDEYHNQEFGNRWFSYVADTISRKSISVPQFFDRSRGHDWIHGPAFEIFLVFIQKNILRLSDVREIIFLRHLCVFLLFYLSVCFFYLLCKLHFKSWRPALLASAFLVLSPRIFADSFYNTVDIACLSFYIICIYTLLRFLDKKTFTTAAIHAFTCALLIGVKATGAALPLYTVVFLTIDALKMPAWRERVKSVQVVLLYVSLLIMLTVIFWPLLWSDTFANLISAVKQMKNYRWDQNTYLYLGKYMTTGNQPWHYAAVWILVSTPIAYSFCFFVGFFVSLIPSLKNSIIPAFSKRNNFLFTLWFFLPLVVSRGKLYDGWRQIYFIYPAFLIFSVTGLIAIWELIKCKFKRIMCMAMHSLLAALVVLNLAGVVYFMVKYHPYQNVYFNKLAGKNMKEIKKRFELDYWGLSYRKALEYILRNDKDGAVKVFAANLPEHISADILTDEYKDRLICARSIGEAKYFLSNYRWHPDEYPYPQEYFSIKIGDEKIVVVYKLK
jgi:hypothetical protein